jgi:hypothetical protein
MARPLRVSVRCPHAKPEDLCALPPGVRYCLCYSDQHREPVGQVSVQHGQILWSVLVGAKPRGLYSYVAVVRQGTLLAPVELQDEASVRETVENGRAVYIVRGPRDQRLEIDASSLIEAAVENREYVDATVVTTH